MRTAAGKTKEPVSTKKKLIGSQAERVGESDQEEEKAEEDGDHLIKSEGEAISHLYLGSEIDRMIRENAKWQVNVIYFFLVLICFRRV
jgi:hypothetical protein